MTRTHSFNLSFVVYEKEHSNVSLSSPLERFGGNFCSQKLKLSLSIFTPQFFETEYFLEQITFPVKNR
jgi:hypothetical protein